jgi:hypothetical protein
MAIAIGMRTSVLVSKRPQLMPILSLRPAIDEWNGARR